MKNILSLLAAVALVASVGTASAAQMNDMMAGAKSKMEQAAANTNAYNECIMSGVDTSMVSSGGEFMSRTKANMMAISDCNKGAMNYN